MLPVCGFQEVSGSRYKYFQGKESIKKAEQFPVLPLKK